MSSLFGNAAPTATTTKDVDREKQRRLAGPWLHAWHDPVAGIKAFSCCVRLTDVMADGEYKLIIADGDRKLKVYKGTDTHPAVLFVAGAPLKLASLL